MYEKHQDVTSTNESSASNSEKASLFIPCIYVGTAAVACMPLLILAAMYWWKKRSAWSKLGVQQACPAHVLDASARDPEKCCAVCLEPLKCGDTVRTLPCPETQHTFHKACIDEWFTSQQKRSHAASHTGEHLPDVISCPICRRHIPASTDLASAHERRGSSTLTTPAGAVLEPGESVLHVACPDVSSDSAATTNSPPDDDRGDHLTNSDSNHDETTISFSVCSSDQDCADIV
eukprot:gnl/TRDRNA2_/TRDRNA2_152265_c0_seq1.p1 gnl/TRDRNA2_/TRDRNA2_152265_c0~~gnl/TRDRNA2_/TRDRNA2_152265_c0_seq1.p1  ORF type:complete len:233 (-),score=30.34 gnl/TRDRNA2_/TRDRNA2_152265_c0_seq1:187-885(-)